MNLNPNATAFTPQPPDKESENGLSPTFAEAEYEPGKAVQSAHRKQQYHIYKAKRRAAVHTILRASYDSAKLAASYESNVYDYNAKDKLIVDMGRLLAGLGWSTSTVLRAAALLEMDHGQDALECLQQAKQIGDEFHQRERQDLDEKEGEVEA